MSQFCQQQIQPIHIITDIELPNDIISRNLQKKPSARKNSTTLVTLFVFEIETINKKSVRESKGSCYDRQNVVITLKVS